MCGIVGYMGKEGFASKSSIESMLEIMAHRGPDARSIFHQENTILGHLRLSIIDLSDAANQPMHSHCQRYVMVYNGEVYNYREIAEEIQLVNPNFRPHTHSDSEIILEAFALWQDAFVSKLNGMFAIAIYDKKHRSLHLFRDRIGIKPIYYYLEDGVFAFSSELKALTQHPEIKKNLDLDMQAINAYLHLGYIPTPLSLYRQIKKFPQGCKATYSSGQLRIHSFWKAEDYITSHQLKDFSQAKDELKNLLISSLQYRLVSDVPYGTFLSGGIDSSLVSAIAQSLHDEPIKTFSIGFWDKKYNEAPYARAIAAHLGTDHHEMILSEEDALEWMPELSGIYDEPFADSSAIPTLLVSQMAKKHVTMTLSGDGGDELFMGYGAYHWANRLANPMWKWMGYPASLLLKMGDARMKRASSLFVFPDKAQLASHIFSQEQYLFSRKEILRVLKAESCKEFSLRETYTQAQHLSAAEQQAFFDLKHYLPDDLLVKVDRASMHFSLETRVPLLDYRIVEWALNLHPSLKLHQGQSKWLLKELLADYIPRELFQRPKRGFAIPLQSWMKHQLKDFVMDHLNEEAVYKSGILEPSEVHLLLKRFYNDEKYAYLYNRIWQLVVLQRHLL